MKTNTSLALLSALAGIVGHASAASVISISTDGNTTNHTLVSQVTPASTVGYRETVSSVLGDYSLGINMSFDPDPHFRTWDDILYNYNGGTQLTADQTLFSLMNTGTVAHTYQLDFQDITSLGKLMLPGVSSAVWTVGVTGGSGGSGLRATTTGLPLMSGLINNVVVLQIVDPSFTALTGNPRQAGLSQSSTYSALEINTIGIRMAFILDPGVTANIGANFEVVPIPEPSGLVFVGFAGLALRRRRV